MTAPTARRPLVRPRFAKWSLVAFLLLAPFAVHALWDYVAGRRLRSAIEAIHSKGEPVTVRDIDRYEVLSSEAAQAARYYLAAAVLASYSGAHNSPILRDQHRRAQDAVQSGELSADAVTLLRAIVEDYQESLTLLDHATPLIFEGFVALDYSYRWAHLQSLGSLAAMRTTLLIHDGNGARAADSLYAEVRLFRPLERAQVITTAYIDIAPVVSRISWLLQRARAPAGGLAKLARSLDGLDRDDRIEHLLLYRRAQTIDASLSLLLGNYYGGIGGRRASPGPLGWRELAVRPWVAGLVKDTLDTLAAQIAAAGRPWPDRIDAVERAAAGPTASTSASARRVVGPAVWLFATRDTGVRPIARNTALLRCARIAVAVERYRADHGGAVPASAGDLVPQYLKGVPIDPYSGEAIRFAAGPDAYAVYSVGTNRVDDGGRFDGTELLGREPGRRLDAAADFGIRIRWRE